MPRTGAYVMVRVAPADRCNQTMKTPTAGDKSAAATASVDAGAAAAGADAAAVDANSRDLCVGSMMAQEGERGDTTGGLAKDKRVLHSATTFHALEQT